MAMGSFSRPKGYEWINNPRPVDAPDYEEMWVPRFSWCPDGINSHEKQLTPDVRWGVEVPMCGCCGNFPVRTVSKSRRNKTGIATDGLCLHCFEKGAGKAFERKRKNQRISALSDAQKTGKFSTETNFKVGGQSVWNKLGW